MLQWRHDGLRRANERPRSLRIEKRYLLRGGGFHARRTSNLGPLLDLNFVANGVDPRIVTSRASGAMYFDSTGTLQTAANNVLRIDYGALTLSGSTITQPANARINWLLNSSQIGTGAWSLGSGTTSAGNVISPTGIVNAAQAFNSNGAGGNEYVYQGLSLYAGCSYTFSVWAQLVSGSLPTSGNVISVRPPSSAQSNVAYSGSALSSSWQKFSVSFTPTIAGTTGIYLLTDANSVCEIALWGAQLELGNTATAFIPTSGTIASAGATPLGALIEEQRTNSIRNPRAEGAIAGTPGTLPTNWAYYTSVTGITRTIVGTGTESGIPYIDINISGTAGSSGNLWLTIDNVGSIGSYGQVWAGSFYTRLMAGTLTGAVFNCETEFNGANATDAAFVPTGNPLASQRQKVVSISNPITGANNSSVGLYLMVAMTNGAAINFTLRIGAPQLELGAFATSIILPNVGSPAATTRTSDLMSVPITIQNAATVAFEATVEGAPASGSFPGIGFRGSVGRFGLFTRSDLSILALSRTSSQTTIGTGTATIGQPFKMAVANNSAQLVAAFNSSVFGPSTPPYFPTDIVELDSAQDGTWNGYIRRVRYWPRALSTAELVNVTT